MTCLLLTIHSQWFNDFMLSFTAPISESDSASFYPLGLLLLYFYTVRKFGDRQACMTFACLEVSDLSLQCYALANQFSEGC